MNVARIAAPLVMAFVFAHGGNAEAGTILIEGGRYEVTYWVELPHLERYAVERTQVICIDAITHEGTGAPLPLLGQNDIFDNCRMERFGADEVGFDYGLVCAERGGAIATATYRPTPGGFQARIAIMQGAKNMTMTEVQIGRRLGACN